MEKSIAVFTTKYVIEENSPILFIFHDEDGSWQFHGAEDNLTENVSKVVSIDEIIKFDKTLIKVLNKIPVGYEAYREKKGKEWTIIKSGE